MHVFCLVKKTYTSFSLTMWTKVGWTDSYSVVLLIACLISIQGQLFYQSLWDVFLLMIISINELLCVIFFPTG